jgi:hypothetical protein
MVSDGKQPIAHGEIPRARVTFNHPPVAQRCPDGRQSPSRSGWKTPKR